MRSLAGHYPALPGPIHPVTNLNTFEMTTERLLEFIGNHLLLSAAVLVVLVLLIGNELLRLIRGEKRLSPSDAVRIINAPDAIVLDVRSASDFKKGHILNARHVPLTKIDEVGQQLSKQKSSPVLCYCALGSSAPQACEKLRKMGFEEVYSMRGGLNAWQNANLPVTTR